MLLQEKLYGENTGMKQKKGMPTHSPDKKAKGFFIGNHYITDSISF